MSSAKAPARGRWRFSWTPTAATASASSATWPAVYTFLIPILGPDSATKSRDIWCAKDQGKVWRAWMLDGAAPPTAAKGCDTAAVDRNLAFSRANRINGTPAVFFEDGTRKPGAISAETVEKLLLAASKK